MGKLGRGALWALFPPAGAVASYRAGKRQDTDRIVRAIRGEAEPQPQSKTVGYVAIGVLVGGYWLVKGLAAVGGAALVVLAGTALLCGAIIVAVKYAERRS